MREQERMHVSAARQRARGNAGPPCCFSRTAPRCAPAIAPARKKVANLRRRPALRSHDFFFCLRMLTLVCAFVHVRIDNQICGNSWYAPPPPSPTHFCQHMSQEYLRTSYSSLNKPLKRRKHSAYGFKVPAVAAELKPRRH